MIKFHLDTDLGGDIDDLCALVMLLCWSKDIELTGITVVGDTNGKRTGYVRYVLQLAGRNDIPVAAGADTSQGFYRHELGLPPEERYWPKPVLSSTNAPEEAIHLLKQSIEQGATIVGIGPFTNLSLLELQHPNILMQANLFLMGGYIFPARAGFPDWGNDMDFNIQVDVKSAKHVLQNSNPTLVPLTVTIETALRRTYLDDLRNAGKLGQLIARQAEAFAEDEQFEMNYGKTCAGLPSDIINFQHDSLACAIALGWDEGIEIQELPLMIEERDGWLYQRIHPSGRKFRVVTRVDGARFNEFWLTQITSVRDKK
jgi:inosine-uridine nucleoside N-ribohydrolase